MLGLGLLLAGCATAWRQELTPEQRSQAVTRFRQEQLERIGQLSRWQARGILEIALPTATRRGRMGFVGESTTRGALTLQGPFQQITLQLVLDEVELTSLEPTQRLVTVVPASREGLRRLAAIDLEPSRLLEIATGVVSAPLNPDDFTTAAAEELQIDPATGLVNGRRGAAPEARGYTATYRWPVQPTTTPVMPDSVAVELDAGGALRIEFRSWEFPVAWRRDPFQLPEAASGFTVRRP